VAELGEVVFLSWVRGALTRGAAAPGAGAVPRMRATIPVDVSSGGVTESVLAPFDLYGPADAGGLSPTQVLRTDPKMGEPEAEPNYLCSIEFDAPELPWALSPELPDGQGRVQPWIALVVVPTDRGQLQQRSGASLPLLRCPSELLPPCDESWAWAHAQVVPGSSRSEADILADPAERPRTLSRLICPTRLIPRTSYLACVVPTFEAGVRVQLGTDPAGAGLDPAWSTSGQAMLPVYYSWRFRTGLQGDFEEIATLLHPVEADGIVGLGRSVLSMSESAIAGVPAQDQLPPIRTLLTTDTEARLIFGQQAPQAVADGLRAIIDPDPSGEGRLKVRPPVYGQWPAQVEDLSAPEPAWIVALNTNPAHRIVARLGADMVRAQQEELVAEARRQAGEHRRARLARDRLRLAEMTSARLYARRLQSLDEVRLIATARPAHTEIGFEAGDTVASKLAASTVDPALLGRSMARVAARTARQTAVPVGALRRTLLSGTFAKEFKARPIAVPELTGQSDRLQVVFERAGLANKIVSDVTIAKLIQIAPMVSSAQTQLLSQVSAVPVVFEPIVIDPPVVDPGVVDPGVVDPGVVDPPVVVTPVVDPPIDEPIIDGGPFIDPNNPGFITVGGTQFPIAVSEDEPSSGGDSGVGGGRVDDLRIVIDRGAIADDLRAVRDRDLFGRSRAADLGGAIESGSPSAEGSVSAGAAISVLLGSQPTVAVHVAQPGVIVAGPIGDTISGALARPRPTVQLSSGSSQALSTVFSDALGPVVAALGTQVAATDVGAFTIDQGTAQVGKTFRERLTGEPSAISQVSVTAALRAKLGLQVVAPINRDRLPDGIKPDFDGAIAGVLDRALSPSLAFPAALVTIDAGQLAQACLTGLLAKVTHIAAVERVLRRANVAIKQSPFDVPLGFVPAFTSPVVARLERSLNAWILAGAGSLPVNAITLLATNPAFVEAFVAGANHEMAGELLWRDVASDPRGTVFTRFWANSPIPPIDQWMGGLGTNADGGQSLVAVVMRSPLLRRYPNTVVYAAKRLDDGEPGFTPHADTVTKILYQGFIEPDLTFSVLDLDVDLARDPNEGWFILVSQPVTDSRFGLDERTGDGAAAPAWNEMRWDHVPDQRLRPDPTGVTLPVNPVGASWGASAADMARILHQDPFRVVMRAANYLPKAPVE
jgi:hypothetical protein